MGIVRKTFGNVARSDIAGVVSAVVVFSLFLAVTTAGFATLFNLDSLSRTIAITTIVGFAQLSVLSIGHFNLALGPMGALGAVCAGALMEDFGVPVVLSILAGILLGTLAGAVQGGLIVKTGINPFVITLSLYSVYLGGVTAVTKAKFYSHMPQAFNNIGIVSVLDVPLLFIVALAIGIVLWILTARTAFGRQLLATGANPAAAQFSGIPTQRVIVTAHAASGCLAAAAGILLASRLGSAQISIGNDWMLVSFAAPVLGGTILSGGKVSVIGTIFGAVLMSLITNALVLTGVSYFWFQSFLGAILLAAFAIDRARLAYIRGMK